MVKELDQLKQILTNVQQQKIYACIQYVMTNGIIAERFEADDLFPTRQDVTHFVLSWLKHIGVSADRCRDWIIRYC